MSYKNANPYQNINSLLTDITIADAILFCEPAYLYVLKRF